MWQDLTTLPGGLHEASSPATPPACPEREEAPSRVDPTPQKKAGRPPGAPSTIVNLRLPLGRLAPLERSIDQREGQTGLKANRAMSARRALALFWETHATGPSAREQGDPISIVCN